VCSFWLCLVILNWCLNFATQNCGLVSVTWTGSLLVLCNIEFFKYILSFAFWVSVNTTQVFLCIYKSMWSLPIWFDVCVWKTAFSYHTGKWGDQNVMPWMYYRHWNFIIFKVLMAVIAVFWDVMPCSLTDRYKCFKGTC
jgi:hypothetical protein